MTARGVFPGSFNPPTVAHLAIATAAREQYELETVHLVVSRRALAKEGVEHPHFDDRVDVIRRSVEALRWLDVVVTEAQLLVDIARGYDLLIIGADKWSQIQEPHWYGTPAARDRALAGLPPTAIVPRRGHPHPHDRELRLDDATTGRRVLHAGPGRGDRSHGTSRPPVRARDRGLDRPGPLRPHQPADPPRLVVTETHITGLE